MPTAVVLQRDVDSVQVWLSDEQRLDVLEAADCPEDITAGTPIELKKDSRDRVLECTRLEPRPLKMTEGCKFLDLFIFPEDDASSAFSLFFGKVPIVDDFPATRPDHSYLVHVTWDQRRGEMIIERQSIARAYNTANKDTNLTLEAYARMYGAAARGGGGERGRATAAVSPIKRADQPPPPGSAAAASRRDDTIETGSNVSSVSARMHSLKLAGRHDEDAQSAVSDTRSSNSRHNSVPPVASRQGSRPPSELQHQQQRGDLQRSTAAAAAPSFSAASREATTTFSSRASHASAGSFGGGGRRPEAAAGPVTQWREGVVIEDRTRGRDPAAAAFVVWTKKGEYKVYREVYENRNQMRVGDHVDIELRFNGEYEGWEVVGFDFAKRSRDFESAEVVDDVLYIRCAIRYREYLNDGDQQWWIAENPVLGRVAVRADDGDIRGTEETLTVRRLPEDQKTMTLLKQTIGWIGATPQYEEPAGAAEAATPAVSYTHLYEGIVTRVEAGRLHVACAQLLPREAVLYLDLSPEQMLGRWIEFRVDRRGANSPPGTLRVDAGTYKVTEDREETRMRQGYPEIRVPLTYAGEEDEGRAMLESSMGRTRDTERRVKMDRDSFGQYTGWIVRYQRPGHASSWRLANEPELKKLPYRVGEGRGRVSSQSTGGAAGAKAAKEAEELDPDEIELRKLLPTILGNDEIRYTMNSQCPDLYNELFGLVFAK